MLTFKIYMIMGEIHIDAEIATGQSGFDCKASWQGVLIDSPYFKDDLLSAMNNLLYEMDARSGAVTVFGQASGS